MNIIIALLFIIITILSIIVFKVKGMDEIRILNCEYGKLGFEPERSKAENFGIMW